MQTEAESLFDALLDWENDYPVGSGLAESGCKQFRTRFVGSGMRRSRAGADH